MKVFQAPLGHPGKNPIRDSLGEGFSSPPHFPAFSAVANQWAIPRTAASSSITNKTAPVETAGSADAAGVVVKLDSEPSRPTVRSSVCPV